MAEEPKANAVGETCGKELRHWETSLEKWWGNLPQNLLAPQNRTAPEGQRHHETCATWWTLGGSLANLPQNLWRRNLLVAQDTLGVEQCWRGGRIFTCKEASVATGLSAFLSNSYTSQTYKSLARLVLNHQLKQTIQDKCSAWSFGSSRARKLGTARRRFFSTDVSSTCGACASLFFSNARGKSGQLTLQAKMDLNYSMEEPMVRFMSQVLAIRLFAQMIWMNCRSLATILSVMKRSFETKRLSCLAATDIWRDWRNFKWPSFCSSGRSTVSESEGGSAWLADACITGWRDWHLQRWFDCTKPFAVWWKHVYFEVGGQTHWKLDMGNVNFHGWFRIPKVTSHVLLVLYWGTKKGRRRRRSPYWCNVDVWYCASPRNGAVDDQQYPSPTGSPLKANWQCEK